MGIVIDARDRFARKSAAAFLGMRLSVEQAKERMALFSDEHASRIGAQARMLRGLPPVTKKPES